MSKLYLKPISLKEASEYISRYHRHHKPPQGYKVGIAAYKGSDMVGVVTLGRPVARGIQDGFTAEVTRLCTNGEPNACSFLYGAARRTALAMGYRRVVTYILETESGHSLKASGWVRIRETQGGEWDDWKHVKRKNDHPTCKKVLWATGDISGLTTAPSPCEGWYEPLLALPSKWWERYEQS